MELVSRLTRLSAAMETSRAMTSAPDRIFFAPTTKSCAIQACRLWMEHPSSGKVKRQREGETGRQDDEGMGRQEGKERHHLSPPVTPSPRRPVSPSLRL